MTTHKIPNHLVVPHEEAPPEAKSPRAGKNLSPDSGDSLDLSSHGHQSPLSIQSPRSSSGRPSPLVPESEASPVARGRGLPVMSLADMLAPADSAGTEPESPRPQPGQLTPLARGFAAPTKNIPEFDEETKTQIGSGAFGQAFLVPAAAGRPPMVVKEIQIRQKAGESESKVASRMEKLLVEAKALDRLSGNEHIPQFMGSEQARGTLKIAMAAAPGSSLRRQTLPETETKKTIRQLLGALSFAHEKGVAHLDVKEGNIMRDPATGHVSLIDWGESRFFDPQNPVITEHLSGGTMGYRNELTENPAEMDIYAVGKTTQNLLGAEGITRQAKKFIARAINMEPISELLEDPWLLGNSKPLF